MSMKDVMKYIKPVEAKVTVVEPEPKVDVASEPPKVIVAEAPVSTEPAPTEAQPSPELTPEVVPVKPSPLTAHAFMKCSDSVYVKKVLEAVKVFGDEATFQVCQEGLSLVMMDPSRVSMLQLQMPRGGFEEYTASDPFKFCVQVESLLKTCLKNLYKEESISFDTNTIGLKVQLQGKFKRNFEVKLLEASNEELPTPKISFDCDARLIISDMVTLLKDAADESAGVRITASMNNIKFEQAGDLSSWNVTLEKGSDTLLNIENRRDTVKAFYSASYLTAIWSCLKSLAYVATLSYSTDMPLRVTIDLEHGLGTINIYLAPRIETD